MKISFELFAAGVIALVAIGAFLAWRLYVEVAL